MRHYLTASIVVALACGFSAGCDLLKRDSESKTPTSPSPSVSMNVFAGTWASTTATTPSTGCGTVRYTVTPVDATTANVTFTATCAGNIQVTGNGTGKITGSSLDWSAQGLVGQGGVNCPFTFTNGKAVEDPGGIKVTYSGTVCGIPVSGTEVVKKS